MAILLITAGATWQQVADAVLGIADLCRTAPHFAWIERPRKAVLVLELKLLMRNLNLEEQWAFSDEANEVAYDGAILIDAANFNLSVIMGG